MATLTVTDLEGDVLKVTDLKAGIKQAREYAAYIPNKGVTYEEKAHEYWTHLLQELEKLAAQHPELMK